MSQAPAAETTVAGRLARRLPFFYGWIIVYISFLGVFLTGATSFWGLQIFVGPIHEDTGWSHASILAGLFIRFITGAFVGFLLGHLVDRRSGPPRLLLVGVLIDAAALVSLRWVESPLQFLLLYGVVGGAGSAGLRLVQATLVPKWFVFKRGAAVGFASMGGGVSALIMVPVVSLLVSGLGWRDAWPALAAIVLVCTLPCVPLAVRSPEDIGLQPDGGALPKPGRRRVTAATERSYTLSEAVHTWRLWLLLLGTLFGSYSLGTNTVILVPYFEEVGFSAGVAASAVAVYGFFGITSRYIWGYAADRFTARPAMIFQAALTGAGALLFLLIEGRASLYAVAAYQGVMLGGFPTLAQLIWPEFFGRRHIGSIIGLTQLFTTFASAGGPLIAGLIHDRSGTYETSVWVLFGTWLACAVIMLSIRPAKEPEAAPAVAVE